MIIRFGRPPADDRSGIAQLRGGAAGSLSGTISVAAHGWASGGMAPSSSTLALLLAASALVGALVAGPGRLRTGSAGLLTVLAAGQLLGHLAMGWGSGHLHHGDVQLTPTMIAAHLVAVVIAALLIRGAEFAYRMGRSALARVVPLRYHPPAIAGPAPLRTTHRDRVILWVLAADASRTRGPPSTVRL
ncbi:hypothetical protein [Nocardia cyriacigeorgica]|uniref:hypothetical protein n=1 Tax=Nocardia cyriacigeorgica TaxID=135487 RepID=UPI0013CF76BB|nr:hypothetical protein [Nocardia cyriacigeorgica]NEW25370.1 hypothetical protein [Nocardia cyriacigeorgica]